MTLQAVITDVESPVAEIAFPLTLHVLGRPNGLGPTSVGQVLGAGSHTVTAPGVVSTPAHAVGSFFAMRLGTLVDVAVLSVFRPSSSHVRHSYLPS